MKQQGGHTAVATNPKARHDYTILETFEAGLVLTGTEVKALRQGRASLVEGYATITDDEVWLRGVHIPEYLQGTWNNHSARRPRKLLLHRRQIDKIGLMLRDGGYALIPLSLYFAGGIAKVEIGLAKGKKHFDKRQELAKRDAAREIERAVSQRYTRGLAGKRSSNCDATHSPSRAS